MGTCTHSTPVRYEWQETEVGLFGETEMQLARVGGTSTYVDLDIGRFKCSQCGEIGYYTGHWKKFFEEGIPCPGSDNIRR